MKRGPDIGNLPFDRFALLDISRPSLDLFWTTQVKVKQVARKRRNDFGNLHRRGLFALLALLDLLFEAFVHDRNAVMRLSCKICQAVAELCKNKLAEKDEEASFRRVLVGLASFIVFLLVLC